MLSFLGVSTFFINEMGLSGFLFYIIFAYSKEAFKQPVGRHEQLKRLGKRKRKRKKKKKKKKEKDTPLPSLPD